MLVGGLFVGLLVVIFIFRYYGSQSYTDVGYRPVQPVPYSHKLHAGDLGIDCRYCHYDVERSPVANVPPTQVCMNCHKIVLPESEKLLPIRESWATDIPMKWVRVHQLPDFVYFDHSMHVTRGVSCISCHGNIANMDVVTQNQPLNMHWCLSCHRNPEPNIRPVDEVTNMNWKRPAGFDKEAKKLIEELKIAPPTDCSGCHR